MYAFSPQGPHQIALNPGDLIRLEEEYSGWYRGTRTSDKKRGIFPANFVHLRPKDSDPTVTELSQVLKEWQIFLKQLYQV